eukprot:m.129338 g.129338  ORF g.129338 m.129338 type:complete len:500 (+) comp11259_c0_seq2:207-1706(+)
MSVVFGTSEGPQVRSRGPSKRTCTPSETTRVKKRTRDDVPTQSTPSGTASSADQEESPPAMARPVASPPAPNKGGCTANAAVTTAVSLASSATIAADIDAAEPPLTDVYSAWAAAELKRFDKAAEGEYRAARNVIPSAVHLEQARIEADRRLMRSGSAAEHEMLLRDDESPLVLVATGFPLDRADPVKWVNKHSGGGFKFLIDGDGNVFIDTCNLPEHARVQSEINSDIFWWCHSNRMTSYLDTLAYLTVPIPGATHTRQSDAAVVPAKLRHPRTGGANHEAYRFVVEVEVANRSVLQARALAHEYFREPNTGGLLLIKIFPTRSDGTFAIAAVLWLRPAAGAQPAGAQPAVDVAGAWDIGTAGVSNASKGDFAKQPAQVALTSTVFGCPLAPGVQNQQWVRLVPPVQVAQAPALPQLDDPVAFVGNAPAPAAAWKIAIPKRVLLEEVYVAEWEAGPAAPQLVSQTVAGQNAPDVEVNLYNVLFAVWYTRTRRAAGFRP